MIIGGRKGNDIRQWLLALTKPFPMSATIPESGVITIYGKASAFQEAQSKL